MVVCCSDGRLQGCIDEFLSASLGIVDYDRMFAPGGPAVLSEVDAAYTRTHQYRADLRFLLDAHGFHRVVLLFHGTAADGPEISGCAHYRQIMPGATYNEIIARHEADRKDVVKYLHDLGPSLDILAFRAETAADLTVRFVDLMPVMGRPERA
jgi:hypothetical protein